LRQLNQTSRAREYLTADEVERMILAARQVGGRVASRDALLIGLAYRLIRCWGLQPKSGI
jgi:hypothetical protein